MKMMAPFFSSHSIDEMSAGWKHPLPAPLFASVWVFALEGIWERDSPQTALKIKIVKALHPF